MHIVHRNVRSEYQKRMCILVYILYAHGGIVFLQVASHTQLIGREIIVQTMSMARESILFTYKCLAVKSEFRLREVVAAVNGWFMTAVVDVHIV